MASLNRVVLVGNLVKDPESKNTDANSVCKLRLAVDRKWKNKAGEMQEETCYVDVKAFGSLAELCSKYLAKGRLVAVEGRLHLHEWQNQQNEKRSIIEVVAERVEFLDSPKDAAPQVGTSAAPSDAIDYSNIPF